MRPIIIKGGKEWPPQKNKMMAALWYGPEELRLEETGIPTVGPGEVLVKIGVALTCGTDFKLFRNGHAVLVKNIPSPFGHEMAGEIVAVGSGVISFRVGERVVAANSAPCGHCFFCVREQWNLCENLEFLNGAYAEYIRIPAPIVARNLYRIPYGVSLKSAALTEPVACALRCIDQSNIRPGEFVCILGAGPQGLLLIQLAKLRGAQVICIGRNPQKLERALNSGADHVFSVLHSQNIQKEIKRVANKGYGPDLVIEATGQPEIWKLAVSLVRRGGRVMFYGGCQKGTEVSLDTHRIHYEEITMNGVFHHTPSYFAKALQLISEGKIETVSLIEGEKKLKEINEIFCKDVPENPLKFAIFP